MSSTEPSTRSSPAIPTTTPVTSAMTGYPPMVDRLAALGVAGLAALAFGACAVLAWATRHGLDLTDEGIYLHTYRSWRDPRLSITGSSVVLGPIFQLLGWSIPLLRLFKLLVLVLSAAFLGDSCFRIVDHVRRVATLRREKRAVLVLGTVLGSLSVYAWVPQSPGYNDLAVLFATLITALVLRWAVSASPRGRDLSGLGIGIAWTALLFTKWPSAFCVAGGVALFAVTHTSDSTTAAGPARRAVLRLIATVIGGIAVAAAAVQLVGGDLPGRLRQLGASGSTQLEGSSVVDLYVRPYLTNLADVAVAVARISVLCAVLPVGLAVLARRRAPRAAALLLTLAPIVTVVRARKAGYLTGGTSNVERVAASLPIGVVSVLIVAAVVWSWSRNEQPRTATSTRRTLLPAVLLVSAMPSLQALGTGNPFFQIASCAGGLWVAGALMVMLVAVRDARPDDLLPAAGGVGILVIVGLLVGVQGLWIEGFRVGPIRNQSLAVRGIDAVDGIHVDAGNRELIEGTAKVLRENGFAGKPGFSAGVATGLTYAVGMPAPLAGIFVEEPQPAPLRSRIREACRLDIIVRDEPPVVLGRGDAFPTVTAEELQRCGIDFPNSYRSVRVDPTSSGSGPMGEVGVTVWLPNG